MREAGDREGTDRSARWTPNRFGARLWAPATYLGRGTMTHDCTFCPCVACRPWEEGVHNFRHRGRAEACGCDRCPQERPAYADRLAVPSASAESVTA